MIGMIGELPSMGRRGSGSQERRPAEKNGRGEVWMEERRETGLGGVLFLGLRPDRVRARRRLHISCFFDRRSQVQSSTRVMARRRREKESHLKKRAI